MSYGTSYQNDVSLPLYYLPSRDIDQDEDGKDGEREDAPDAGGEREHHGLSPARRIEK